MSGPYGYDRATFLQLEPDEVAAAILPSIKAVAARGNGTVNRWNVLLEAKQQLGEEEAEVVAEGWQWLVNEGFLAPSPVIDNSWLITRRGTAVALDTHIADARALGILTNASLDDEIVQVAMPIFRRGHYDLAVLAAMRVVEERVRAKSTSDIDSAVKLMHAVFGVRGEFDDPALDLGERTGRANLFAGAFGVYRNPPGHRTVNYDPQEAAEIILLANNLLRHLGYAVKGASAAQAKARREARRPSDTGCGGGR